MKNKLNRHSILPIYQETKNSSTQIQFNQMQNHKNLKTFQTA